MKLRVLGILSLILLNCGCILSQSTKKYKMLNYYSWGSPSFCIISQQCLGALEIKYGLRFKKKGGCTLTRNKRKRWKKHNAKVSKKMEERHGVDWKKRYFDEKNICPSKCH